MYAISSKQPKIQSQEEPGEAYSKVFPSQARAAVRAIQQENFKHHESEPT